LTPSTRLLGANALVALAAVTAWLVLVAAEQAAGRSGILQFLYLAVLVLCSAGYWRVNGRLASRFRSPELGILLLAALCAVLTALTLVVGAAASTALSAWLTSG
jgi:hypothetical protein